jgi:cell division septation protein DedD
VNNYSNKQTQFELFPGVSGPSPEVKSARFFPTEMTFTWENLVVLTGFIIVVMVLSYSLGVNQGRRHVASQVVEQPQTDVAVQPAPVEVPEVAVQEKAAVEAPVTVLAAKPSIDNVLNLAVPAGDKENIANDKKDDTIYTIQIASFKGEKWANQEAEVLKKKGFESIVLPKGKHSIVCIGKFDRRNDAQTFSTKLKGRYKDCLVRRL